LIRFDCYPNGLNNFDSGMIDSGAVPIIPNNTAYYEIEFDISNPILLRFDIIEDDCRYEKFRLHYLNKDGAFESESFMKGSKHTSETTREKYKAIVGGLASSTNYSYAVSDRSTKTFYTKTKDKYHVGSDWLTEDYKELLEELITSPIVIWEDILGNLNPIDITSNSFEFDKSASKKMFRLELDFEVSYDRYRQRE